MVIKKEQQTEFEQKNTASLISNQQEREFPKLKSKLDLLDWQNVKEAAINQINSAKAQIELQSHLLLLADVKIKELTRGKD